MMAFNHVTHAYLIPRPSLLDWLEVCHQQIVSHIEPQFRLYSEAFPPNGALGILGIGVEGADDF